MSFQLEGVPTGCSTKVVHNSVDGERPIRYEIPAGKVVLTASKARQKKEDQHVKRTVLKSRVELWRRNKEGRGPELLT